MGSERYTDSAAIYDIVYREIIDYPATAARLSELIRSINPQARTVLEAACGTGAVLEHLVGDFDVAGFDLSEQMIDVASAKLPGVELRRADMVDFDWGRKFDAVICMFSSIGYLTDLDALARAYRRFAAHLEPGGVLVVEPWLRPDLWNVGFIGTAAAESGGVKVQRMNSSWLEDDGRVSVMDMHHLVGTTGDPAVRYFVERHRMSLVTVDEHLAAFASAGLEMTHDPDGLIGRGLYVGGLA